MEIKVGNAPVSWGIMEIEGWSEQKPYGETLDEIAQAGYAGTELGPYGYFPAEPEQLRLELMDRKLEMVTAFVPVDLANPAAHEAGFQEAVKTAKLLASVGARLILLSDAMNKSRIAVAGRVDPARDGMSDEQWNSAARIVTRIAEACGELGLATAFTITPEATSKRPMKSRGFATAFTPNCLGYASTPAIIFTAAAIRLKPRGSTARASGTCI